MIFAAVLSWPGIAGAGDVFTGFQMDDHSQYYAYMGVRTPIMATSSNLQPFVQFMGAGLGYSFKDRGTIRDAEVQFATPALGLKYRQGPWTVLGFAGPQLRWKQADLVGGGKSHEQDIGFQLQGEAFRWHEQGTVHAIVSYTNLDGLVWSRLRATRLVYKNDQNCCSLYLGWDIAGMGNKDFYAVQTGPIAQVPIGQFYLTLKGGYQYSQTFLNGAYGGLEVYVPF
ncbi:MAG: cellulose biosynthesis protein BcsS [Nitrospira sp.]|nr:cellulose biosynthesis protein BcsS [Nitrospira sp.]